MKLILFDIDGTLIRSHGAGRQTLDESLQELFGTSGPIQSYRMSGKTDSRIITDLLTAAKIPQAKFAPMLPEVYQRMAQKGLVIFWEKRMEACPGVKILLEQIRAHSHEFLLGLLTGNAAETAPLKLSAAGITPTQFAVGAYGSEAMDRNALPALAMQRAAEFTGHSFDGSNTVIIGDTPADILCARASRSTAVAVASGWHSAATLANYKPDHLLDNLTETEYILNLLLGNQSEIDKSF